MSPQLSDEDESKKAVAVALGVPPSALHPADRPPTRSSAFLLAGLVTVPISEWVSGGTRLPPELEPARERLGWYHPFNTGRLP